MPCIRIAIDADLFSAISPAEKETITAILKETNVLTQDGTFEGEGEVIANAQAVIADPQSALSRLLKRQKRNLCRTGCDVAASAAAVACTAGTAGVGLVACLTAAAITGDAC